MSVYYDPQKLREYAALSNSPIIYCLTYERETHRIAGLWAYEWLINFVNTGDPAAFHPHALRLIKENLAKWKSPFAEVDDYGLFLRRVINNPQFLDELIEQAIKENRILYLDKSRTPWAWNLSYAVL